MILSEQARKKLLDEYEASEESLAALIEWTCEDQYKADQEDFQKQKQEMWRDFMGHISMKTPNEISIVLETGQLECLRHKWGIE